MGEVHGVCDYLDQFFRRVSLPGRQRSGTAAYGALGGAAALNFEKGGSNVAIFSAVFLAICCLSPILVAVVARLGAAPSRTMTTLSTPPTARGRRVGAAV